MQMVLTFPKLANLELLRMSKSILYRLFGIGKIPEQYAIALKSEGVILFDEGLKGSVTYLDFRAPGKYSNWQRQ